jgi:hypothetical protein
MEKALQMSYETYLELVKTLIPYVQHEDTRLWEAIPADKAVAMVIYRLATGMVPLAVAEKFGVCKSTVIKYTDLITEALANPDKLARRYINIPSGQRLRKIIADFGDGTGLDNMVGAIDGSHIKLFGQPPTAAIPGEYWCRHDFHSILLQGICDYNKVFWDVCCRAPGGTHDATHLRSSGIWEKLRENLVLQEPIIHKSGNDFKPYIVGDSAYPLMAFLIKAFNDRATGSALQNAFDRQLRLGRVKIENAFGLLKNRWQICKCLNVGLDKATQVVTACCVLHNICMIFGEPTAGLDEIDPHPNDIENQEVQVISEAASKRIETDVRSALFRDFIERLESMSE